MTQPSLISCAYCASKNPADRDTCLACGAPLIHPKPNPIRIETVKTSIPFEKDNTFEKIRSVGQSSEKVYQKALYGYALLWRTLAEAGVIAICGFGIGFSGGVTENGWLGLLGAALLGLAVGLTIKMSYLIWLMTPGGLIIGLAIGVALWAFGLGTVVFTPALAGFSCLASLLFGSPIPFRHRNLYEKIRPFLGAIGGASFGLLGMLLGLGFQALFKGLLGG